MIIYVDASVIQTGNGTKENPFKTIQEAAAKALPGDEVIVAPGLYRTESSVIITHLLPWYPEIGLSLHLLLIQEMYI